MQKLTQYEINLIIEFAPKTLDLSYLDLRGADLRGADLRRADLRRADLRGADLRGADLERAILERTNLIGADLERANLRGAYLERANLEGAKIDYQIEEGLIQKIRDIVFHNNKNLFMRNWHYGCDDASCGTAHCIAGWACELGKNGKELEKKYGPEVAGLLLLGPEAHGHFFDDNYQAIQWLKTQ